MQVVYLCFCRVIVSVSPGRDLLVSDSIGSNVWVYNLVRDSRGGHSVRDIKEKIDEGVINVRRFGVIVLLIGTVDVLQIFDWSLYTGPKDVALRILCAGILTHQVNPSAVLGVCNIIPMVAGTKYDESVIKRANSFITATNSHLKSLIRNYRFLSLINMHKCMCRDGVPNSDLYDHTGYHLSGAGVRIVSMRVKQFIGYR